MTIFESLGGGPRIGLIAYVLISLGIALSIGWMSLKEQAFRWHWVDTRKKVRCVLEALVIALFSLAFWPILFPLVLIQDRFPACLPRWLKPDPVPESLAPEPEFRILPEHLGELVDVDMLEVAQRVSDPLRAVPDLPFGHLHARWLLLRIHLETGRSLRRFAVPRRGPRRNCPIIHSGWAVVDMDSTIVSYWVTEWEQLDAVTPAKAATIGSGAQP